MLKLYRGSLYKAGTVFLKQISCCIPIQLKICKEREVFLVSFISACRHYPNSVYGKKLFVNLEISKVDKYKFTKLPCQKIVDPTLSGTTYYFFRYFISYYQSW